MALIHPEHIALTVLFEQLGWERVRKVIHPTDSCCWKTEFATSITTALHVASCPWLSALLTVEEPSPTLPGNMADSCLGYMPSTRQTLWKGLLFFGQRGLILAAECEKLKSIPWESLADSQFRQLRMDGEGLARFILQCVELSDRHLMGPCLVRSRGGLAGAQFEASEGDSAANEG